MNSPEGLLERIKSLPVGYSEGMYNDKKYGITKEIFNAGKSYKIFGKELQGTDFISLNYYITSKDQLLKPCEMPTQKVVHFLNNVALIENKKSK